MSRHRNIRGMDLDEEYEGYYSCYGHSVEEDSCISPRTEAQFLYDRDATNHHSMSAFLDSGNETLYEENDEDSADLSNLDLDDVTASKLQSCIEAMQNVVGEAFPETALRKVAIDHNFDFEKSLDAILTGHCSKPSTAANVSDVRQDSQNKKEPPSPNIQRIEKIKSKDPKFKLKQITDFNDKKENVLLKSKEGSDKIVKNLSDNLSEISTESEATAEPLKIERAIKDVSEIYKKERSNAKPLINLVVIGHVDAGKSTLMGHVLFKLGFVSKKTIHKYEQESKKLGKASFMYAWVLDESSEERNRGITMDIAQSKFETPDRCVCLLDAPGHKDFIPNMITGASQADVAILVVDATRGEFETGFETGGQTREHTMLIRSLGVSQLAVAVNKMDNVKWDQERYNDIVKKLSAFLKQAGFKDSDVTFVPCSGLTGDNLVIRSQDCDLNKWYNGPTLVDVINSFNPPERLISKPLRLCVSDVFKGTGSKLCISGRIESGFMQNNDKVLIMPAGEQAIIKSITVDENTVQHSFAGDQVLIQVAGIDMNNVPNGSMVCDISKPLKVSTSFQARLVIFNITRPIVNGDIFFLHYQNMCEQAVIKKMVSQLHRSTGEVIKKKPRRLTKNSSAVVLIEVGRPICLELYKDFKNLGKFMLRSDGSTVAAGIVTEIF